MSPIPLPESEPEPEVEPLIEVEPVPEWKTALEVWGAAWQIHWIGFGVLFFFLAVYCIIAVIRLRRTRTIIYRKYFLAVNSLMIVMGLSRALYLCINPYESFENIPEKNEHIWISRILFVIAFPCETSAFCLIQLALLEISKIQVASPKIQNLKVLLSIIIFHFFIAVVAEVIALVEGINKAVSRGIWIACQIFFIIWGLVLSLGFCYAGGKIIQSVKTSNKFFTNNTKDMRKISSQSKNNTQDDLTNRATLNAATAKIARVTFATAFLGLGICALQIYSLLAVYELYNNTLPKPWPWWSYQTCFRLLEFVMGCTVAYSVSQRLPSKRSNQRGNTETHHMENTTACLIPRNLRVN